MSTSVSIRRTLLAGVTALVLAVALTACGSDSGDDSGNSAPNSSTGSASTGADGSGNGGAGSGKGSGKGSDDDFPKGSFELRDGLPKGYPADDVPLVDGKVLQGMSGAFAPSGERTEGWTVRVLSKDSFKKTVAAVSKTLKGAGLHAKGKARTEHSPGKATFADDDYTVNLTLAKQKKSGTLVIYSVLDR